MGEEGGLGGGGGGGAKVFEQVGHRGEDDCRQREISESGRKLRGNWQHWTEKSYLIFKIES